MSAFFAAYERELTESGSEYLEATQAFELAGAKLNEYLCTIVHRAITSYEIEDDIYEHMGALQLQYGRLAQLVLQDSLAEHWAAAELGQHWRSNYNTRRGVINFLLDRSPKHDLAPHVDGTAWTRSVLSDDTQPDKAIGLEYAFWDYLHEELADFMLAVDDANETEPTEW